MNIGIDYRKLTDSSERATNLVYGVDLIAAELDLLLSMQKHQLFFGNDIGLDLERYMYLENKNATFNLIKSDIEKLFNKYRRARLVNFKAKFNDNSIEIELQVSPLDNQDRLMNIPLTVKF